MDLFFDLARIAAGLLLAQAMFSKLGSFEDEMEKVAAWLSGFQGLIGGFAFILGIIYVLKPGCLLMDLSGILAGMILFGYALARVPGIGEHLQKASNSLRAFSYPIGMAAIVSGVLGLFGILCI